MTPYPYQAEVVQKTIAGFEQFQKQLIVVPTGGGKTPIFAMVANHYQPGKTLILAHREELIDQAIDKVAAWTGIRAGKEKAEYVASLDDKIVVASVQTMIRRLDQWPSDHFELVVCDEAHHSISPSWRTVLDHFIPAKVLGVTATPDRGDKRNLGLFYENIAAEVKLFDLINQGYLSKIAIKAVPLKIDISKVEIKNGDYSDVQLSDALEPYLRHIVHAILEHAPFRQTLVFLPLRATSKKFAEICRDEGLTAVHIDGESEDRAEITQRFNRREIQLVSNAMLWCLDEHTELLTDKGWVTYDSITHNHRVANWNFDGSVFFERALEYIHRPLTNIEHMVSIESKMINLRVTNTHRMIVKCGRTQHLYKKLQANELRSHHILPCCGLAKPFDVSIEEKPTQVSQRKISANAYNLRKNNKTEWSESFREATLREHKRCSLTRVQPKDLSEDQCRFIGFWIADGSATRLQSGGIEYKLFQGVKYPFICNWIDGVINRLGFHYRKTIQHKVVLRRTAHVVTWSLCRGTGGGCQERAGIYGLEPYLTKEGCDLFWGLNESQFDALVEGYWMGDGFHGQAEHGMPKSVSFTDTKRKWIDQLCAIGSVRNWKCSVSVICVKNPKHNDQWTLRMIKNGDTHISSRTPIVHEQFEPEDVWCVRTHSKNIITRRDGRVVIMGNTEGYDNPSVDCIVPLRPTKSRALFSQIVGRGTRKFPGKESMLLLDFLWQHEQHNLIRPAHLIAPSNEIADEITERSFEKTGGESQDELDLQDLASDVQLEREKRLQEQLAANEKRKLRYTDAMDFCLGLHEIEVAEFEPTMPWHELPVSEGQAAYLANMKIDPDSVRNRGHASALIDMLAKRSKLELASPGQIRLMKQFKHPSPYKATREQAERYLDARIKYRKR